MMILKMRRPLAAATVAVSLLATLGSAAAAGLTKTPAAMVSGLANSATTDTTNAGNITSGTLPAAQLPLATSSAAGAVLTGTAAANQFQTGIGATGAPTFAQPSFGNLSGSLGAGQVPATAVNTFTGDNSTTAFALSAAPYAATKVSAWIGGVYQNAASFTVSGTTLTFAAAPPNGVPIEVKVGP